MSTQASVYNRSWLKPQWAKLLVLIVLIVPLFGAAGDSKRQAAALNEVLPSPRDASSSTPQDAIALSSSPQMKATIIAKLRAFKKSLKSKLKSKLHGWMSFLWKNPETDAEEQEKKEFFARMKLLLESAPPRTEVPKSPRSPTVRSRRLNIESNLDTKPTGGLNLESFRLAAVNLLSQGHFVEVSLMLHLYPGLLYHDRKDFAYGHEFVMQLAKKAQRSENPELFGEITVVQWVVSHSDCKEWVMPEAAPKIDESCSALRDIKVAPSSYLDVLVNRYEQKIYECSTKKQFFSVKSCSLVVPAV